MLSLASETAPDWAARVLADPIELLIDHAHCEKKAAGTAVRLLFRYPREGALQAPLSRLAREELVHFEQVLALLEARGASLRPLRPSPYAGRLRRLVRAPEAEQLVDTLLVASLIEARSCERFQALAAACADVELAAFYRGLLASEARHHQVYTELACAFAPADAVRDRLAELAREEAEILASLPALVRMHA
jgi:tRNA-(ms[2]io[6]A)-hydroxylase